MIGDRGARGLRGAPRVLSRGAGALALAAVAGCASLPPGQQPNPKDPFERFNRSMFSFNDVLDDYALKPVAKGYEKVIPSPIRTGVHNFFGNISDVWSTANQLLQGKFDNTATMGMRVLANTFFGLGGILDPATEMGLERKSEDFGQTLGRWGVPPGPYLVLPLFGPSDVRDAIAFPADEYVGAPLLVGKWSERIGLDVLAIVDARANLLSATEMLNDIALDRYSFVRDAYVARRRSLVYDGNPPPEPEEPDDSPAPAPGDYAPPPAPSDYAPPPPAAPAAPASAAAPAAPGSAPAPAVAPSAPAPASASAPELPGSAIGNPASPVAPSAPSAPSSSPGGIQPAPLPASAPPLPVPPPGPVPVPPPPASAPQ
jgi:phospholipid-binding lipoprotein MlaA